MQKVEIRVRPVIHHVVTRYTSESHPNGMASGGLETVGEFPNEGYAEQVAAALRDQTPKPRQYVVVERAWDAPTNAVYFDVEADALAYVEHAASKGREFRVFSREITIPVALAHHETGMVSYGFPGGIEQVQLPPELPAYDPQPVTGAQ